MNISVKTSLISNQSSNMQVVVMAKGICYFILLLVIIPDHKILFCFYCRQLPILTEINFPILVIENEMCFLSSCQNSYKVPAE